MVEFVHLVTDQRGLVINEYAEHLTGRYTEKGMRRTQKQMGREQWNLLLYKKLSAVL